MVNGEEIKPDDTAAKMGIERELTIDVVRGEEAVEAVEGVRGVERRRRKREVEEEVERQKRRREAKKVN